MEFRPIVERPGRSRSRSESENVPPTVNEVHRRSSSTARYFPPIYKTSKQMPPTMMTKSVTKLVSPSVSVPNNKPAAIPLKSALKKPKLVDSNDGNVRLPTQVARKCSVETVYSPEEFYVRFLDEENSYESFKVLLETTLASMKKNQRRFLPLRNQINVGTVCLCERSISDGVPKGFLVEFDVYRVKIGVVNNCNQCIVHFLDTGETVEVNLNSLWPLLPELFYEDIILKSNFVRKCSLPWYIGFGKLRNPASEMKQIFTRMCKGKIFSCEIIERDNNSSNNNLKRDNAEVTVVELRLPDVAETFSSIFRELLIAVHHDYPFSLQCGETFLHEIEWQKCGKENDDVSSKKCIIPDIKSFALLPKKERLQKIVKFICPERTVSSNSSDYPEGFGFANL